MTKPKPTVADWRAQVDKELAGAAFDTLVTTTPEGLQIQPLYTETRIDPGLPGAAPFTRGGAAEARPFQVCMRANAANIVEQIDGGADAVWLSLRDAEALAVATARGIPVVADVPSTTEDGDEAAEQAGVDSGIWSGASSLWSGYDFIADVARGLREPRLLTEAVLCALAPGLQAPRGSHRRMLRVTGLPYHEAGADAADELALMLASAAAYLRASVDGNGIAIDDVSSSMWAQVALGRDTFGELCKLRALRVVWHKLMSAAGAKDTALTALHAVCSSRTQSPRDPWVNMLRASTQVFAAALGGAQLVTPSAFDEALGPASAHGLRVARNTALVLREESHLGRVIDAAGGSYYIEERTDALAREAWARFTQIERDGGMVTLIASGGLRERLARSWAAFAARREPVLGVSEFVDAGEAVPADARVAPPPPPALVPHRDADAFATELTR
jgi:methylmalonyl-CoA mutase